MSTCGVNRNKTYLEFSTAKLSLNSKQQQLYIYNYRQLPKFSPFQFPHFGLLICFAVSWVFFAVSLFFFRRFKTGKHMQNDKNAKLFGGRTMPPAIIPEKVKILHTLEDAGMLIMGRMGPNFEFKGVLT